MLEVSTALAPVFVLVLLGALFRRWDFPGAAFWPLAERFTYYVLFPSLLVYKLSLADLSGLTPGPLLAVLGLSVLLASVLLLAVQRCARVPGGRFTSFYQGGIRFNTYVGLAATLALFGESALPLAALFLALMIPLVNVLCVLVFSRYGERGRAGLPATLGNLAANPLILACLVGVGLNLSGLGLPLGSAAVLELLSGMALPLGLLAVGVGLNFSALRPDLLPLLVCSAFKLLLMPALLVLIGSVAGLPGTELHVLALLASLPTAPSAYILARQLGGDAPLMAALITCQTLLAALTIPLVMVISERLLGAG